MLNFTTLSIYLSKSYIKYFTIVLLLITGMLVLSNVFDVLHKFKTIYIPSKLIWKLVLYKIPYLLGEISPLLSFISMLFFLRQLTKYNELVIILCSGTHIWKIFIVPVVITFLIGAIFVAVINPIGSYGLQKYEKLERSLINKKHSDFIVTKSGILFFEEYSGTNRVIQAESINLATKELKGITILFIDSNNSLLQRIDADKAILNNGNFQLFKLTDNFNDGSQEYDNLTIPTNLSMNEFIGRFISPEMISVWNLKSYINKFTKFGLPITNYKVHYYKLLFKPLVMICLVVFASCFISLKQRTNSQATVLIRGLIWGFVVYSLLEVLVRILISKNIDPIFAILLPHFFLIFISNFAILHIHEAL
jgi:lipopolysaccharide export system permease protein